jgi:hypothetical protein
MAKQAQSGITSTSASAPVAPAIKPNYKYLRDKDREIVKGIFRFHEVPGGQMEFSFKKWKEDQVENFKLQDGEIYSLPLGVAKHLNKDCWYPVHSFMMNESNVPTMKVNQKVRRCSFQSLEFVDIEDLAPAGQSIIMVESL